MSTDWNDVSFVICSSYRVEVLRRLGTGPATPSQIARDADCAIGDVSRALGDLRDRDLVDLLVSESRQKGRIYGATDHGLEVWETIRAQSLA